MIFDWLYGLFSNDLAIDLGTATTLIYVKGKGIVSKKVTGDLIVTVEVDVPTQLSDEQRTAIEALAAATIVSPRTRLES